ncbi:peptidoglycan-binding domain-containing protein [Terrabacter sp. NPDC080008]|uniref:peptidoglycan-binding domain-containing protein n=1 Tax=Terrabacter sp. NPDC080008 TaxID=3155176 RepID=UPI00344F1302
MNHHLPRRLRGLGLMLSALASLALLSTAAPSATAATTASVRVPAVPTGLPTGIEGLSPYVPATGCDVTNRPGTVKLAKLIQATYANTYGLASSCTSATSPSSEHFDGRAIDTFFSVRNSTQKAQAGALINWLLATDKAGNPYANARRLGVMYLIWDNKIWSSYRSSEGWRPYSTCATTPSTAYDTACHRNHIHVSLSWEGAQGRTSFWTKAVAPVDWGPCRPADLNWSPGVAAYNPRRCASFPVVKAPTGASALLKELVPRSGMVLRTGMSGPAVTSLQKALGVSPTTGNFGSITSSRLKAWQTRHGLPASGVAYASTWRSLLAANGMPR